MVLDPTQSTEHTTKWKQYLNIYIFTRLQLIKNIFNHFFFLLDISKKECLLNKYKVKIQFITSESWAWDPQRQVFCSLLFGATGTRIKRFTLQGWPISFHVFTRKKYSWRERIWRTCSWMDWDEKFLAVGEACIAIFWPASGFNSNGYFFKSLKHQVFQYEGEEGTKYINVIQCVYIWTENIRV